MAFKGWARPEKVPRIPIGTRSFINHPQCQESQQRGQPVISINSKKKELVGDFKNGGRKWHPKGKPESVHVHDFEDKQKGKVTPHGVYDIGRNQGWVTLGIDHDTAEFAVDLFVTGGGAWASPPTLRPRNC